MRNPERINIFLKKIKEDNNLEKVLNEIYRLNVSKEVIKIITSELNTTIPIFWIENPDWRFSQILINSGLLPNYQGFWYYIEDEDVLIELGCKPREIYFWGVNFTKDMEELSKTKWTLIKDLDTDHIKAILEGKFVREKDRYYKFFTEELKLRKNENMD